LTRNSLQGGVCVSGRPVYGMGFGVFLFFGVCFWAGTRVESVQRRKWKGNALRPGGKMPSRGGRAEKETSQGRGRFVWGSGGLLAAATAEKTQTPCVGKPKEKAKTGVRKKYRGLRGRGKGGEVVEKKRNPFKAWWWAVRRGGWGSFEGGWEKSAQADRWGFLGAKGSRIESRRKGGRSQDERNLHWRKRGVRVHKKDAGEAGGKKG